MRTGDGKNSDPGWKNIRIRDKHPGTATLVALAKVHIGWAFSDMIRTGMAWESQIRIQTP
jgi:hypothetical protein